MNISVNIEQCHKYFSVINIYFIIVTFKLNKTKKIQENMTFVRMAQFEWQNRLCKVDFRFKWAKFNFLLQNCKPILQKALIYA